MTQVAPPWRTPRTAYVHVPFCAHHCGYCDFAVAAGQDHRIDDYLAALELELQTLETPRPVESLFIGGGTPTHLAPAQLQRLCTAIQHWFPRVGVPVEWSIESTPESITAEKIAVLKSAGVTRVSIGVQSFHARTLAALDRLHRVDEIHTAVDTVHRAGLDLSLDLIFAAPGQSLADWRRDLALAMSFAPQHVSTYGLTYEKGTPLWKRRAAGDVRAADEDLELAMYRAALEDLGHGGYEHYEVSNFARPGHRCRHNERYWANHAYYGVGVGAARYVDEERAHNIRNTADYIRKCAAGEDVTQHRETLVPRERAFETLAVQLRRRDGIARTAFLEQTGFSLESLIGTAITHYVAEGLLHDDGANVSLTPHGLAVADGIIAALMKSL